MTYLDFARDRSVSPRYVFVGRLVREKGFDIVIALAKEFLSYQMRKGLLEIYGSGPLKADLLMELSRFPGFFDASRGSLITPGAQVVYFGQVNGTRVAEALNRAHYLLMPSRFLETFGLSALEAIESGVPVIGFDQGGLRQFLLSEHRVPAGKGRHENFLKTVRETDTFFSGPNWRRQSLSVQDISKKFGRTQWLEDVRKQLDPTVRKILVVSDYSAQIGGIESHVQGTVETLGTAGYEIDSLFGMDGKSRWVRYAGLLVSWMNFGFAFRLWRRLRKFRPDAVWIHSEVRCIGPVWLLPLLRYRGEIVKTYHDLGYFWAFPTEFTEETQLGVRSSFAWFFARSRGLHRYFVLHILAKFFQIQAIRRIVGTRGLHIVPSEFMLPAVGNFVEPEARIVKISHFSPHHP